LGFSPEIDGNTPDPLTLVDRLPSIVFPALFVGVPRGIALESGTILASTGSRL
jgi:hypothetical protein